MISTAFAQSVAPAATGGGSLMSSMLLPLLILGGFFLLIVWPQMRQQKKQQKERDDMLGGLHKGDEVETSGGLLGKIVKLGDLYITLELNKGVEIQVLRDAIVKVLPKGTMK